MTAALAVPLTQTQLDTANRLHSRLKQWAAVDNALMALAQAFPAFGPEASLLKVAAVNQLYGTNLYAVVRMAEHVQHVMATTDPKREGPALVERLATLPPASAQERQRHHYSFASKFAHFFVDAEHFPIFDKYARQMLDRHLGRQGRVVDPQHPYQAYVANLGRLRERSGLTWSGRENQHGAGETVHLTTAGGSI